MTTVEDYCRITGQPNPTTGSVPTNMWVAEIEVRKKGAIGAFWRKNFVTRAEPKDVRRYLLQELDMDGYEPRAIIWIRRIE